MAKSQRHRAALKAQEEATSAHLNREMAIFEEARRQDAMQIAVHKLTEAIVAAVLETELTLVIQEDLRHARVQVLTKVLAGCIAVTHDPAAYFENVVELIRELLEDWEREREYH